jgi:transcriptional regulator with XRE-family HTH domain
MSRLNYVLQPENLAIATFDPQTEMPMWKTMHSSHVSFNSIVRALKKGDSERALRLFDKSQLIADKSQGKVTVKKDGVFYNGTLLNNSLTTRILNLIKEGKSVSHMLKFMDRLYLNPSQDAINELFDWLNGCKLPITDDGRFVAYRRVRSDYKDVFTGTIDNSVGQLVYMKRSDVCSDRHNTCAQGLHFCSIAYLPSYPGDRIMQVVVDPADVVSIPSDYNYTKGRTWQYEVVKEIPRDQITDMLDRGMDIDDYKVAVYSIAADRKKLVADILSLNTVKAMLRKAKKVRRVKKGRKAKNSAFLVTEQSIRKMTYGRLVNLFKMYAPPEPSNIPVGTFFDELTGRNRLQRMRKAYGFSMGQVAEKMKVSYKTIYNTEIARSLPQATIDEYLDALMRLQRLGDTEQTGLSMPKPTQKRRAAAVGSSLGDEVTGIGDDDEITGVDEGFEEETGDEFGYEEYEETDEEEEDERF